MHVGTDACMVNFRGRSYTATMIGADWEQGDTGYFVECPRGKYWITREQGSWYANRLENWLRAGLKANVTLEYFLRKCEKYRPFEISSDGTLLKNPAPKIPSSDPTVSNFGTDAAFTAIDANGDGKISLAEWLAAGGNESMFSTLDKDGDGYISREEWGQARVSGGKIRVYDAMLGAVDTGDDDGGDE